MDVMTWACLPESRPIWQPIQTLSIRSSFSTITWAVETDPVSTTFRIWPWENREGRGSVPSAFQAFGESYGFWSIFHNYRLLN